MAAATGESVVAAFLELEGPDVGTAIAGAVAGGHDRITVMPHFLAPGNHTTRDIPALVDAARTAHPGVDIEVLPHTGEDPELVQVLARALGSDGIDPPG